jgi:hypothetical protein
MVTQITLKTELEGPHGLPSGRRTEVDPLYPGLIILTLNRLRNLAATRSNHSRGVSLCANASTREGGGPGPGWQRSTNSVVGPHPPRLARDYEIFVRVSLAGIEPVAFRVKSDLRRGCAIA